MSIYPKKNAHGLPSGSYMVEVTGHDGKRKRGTAKSLEEARVMESSLRLPPQVRADAPISGQTHGPIVTNGYTVGQLRRDARVVWKGTKSEAQSIQRFEDVCDLLGADSLLANVRTARLDAVVSALGCRDLSPQTIHRYLAAFSAGLRWAVQRDHLAGMPVIPWPKTGPAKKKLPISPEDDAKVIDWLHKHGGRDIVVVVDVQLATGCRISEVLGVDPDDVDLEAETVTFRDTKNGEDRTVHLQKDLGRLLAALATVGMPTYRRISLALHRARKALRIEQAVTTHVFRHTAGSRLDDLGVSPRVIQEQLGHKNIKTTFGYITPGKAARQVAATHLERPARRGSPGGQGVSSGVSKGTFGVPRGSGRPSADRFQPIEIMEASPGFEPGLKDLQGEDVLDKGE